MGCLGSKVSQQQIKSIKFIPFKNEGIGLLRAKIQPVKEANRTQQFYSPNQNYLQISVCHQKFLTSLDYDTVIKQTLNPTKNYYEFAINQVDIQKCLEVKIFSLSEKGQSIKVASSKEVLKDTFFLPQKDQKQTQSHNLYLASEKDEKVGWVRVQLQFIPKQYNILITRVNSVTLRNQPNQGHPIYVSIKIGGQQFQTQSLKSTFRSIPQWQRAEHPFIVPEFLEYGKLAVYAKDLYNGYDYLVGELKFDLKIILQSDSLQTFSEQITLKGRITGTVCLQFLKTKNMIPQTFVLQRQKRIKFIQNFQQEIQQKHNRKVANYISKKESQATNSTSDRSLNRVFENNLNKKLQELKKSNIRIPTKKSNHQFFESDGDHSPPNQQQKNEFFYDRQQRIQGNMKRQNPECILIDSKVQRVFSDPQLSFSLEIPQTQSKIFQEKHGLIRRDRQSRESRISRKRSISKKKQSSIKILRDSIEYKNGSKKKINILSEQNQDLLQRIQQKIKQKQRALLKENLNEQIDFNSFQFESLPDQISSKSVNLKNGSVLQNFQDNKSQIFSNSLNEKSNSNESHNKFSNEIKLMQDKNRIRIEEQKQISKFGKKQYIKNLQPNSHKYDKTQKQNQNSQQSAPNYCYADFEIKISSIIAKKGIVSNL